MKIPKKLKIGGVSWAVTIKDIPESEGALALTDSKNCTIEIQSGMNMNQIGECFIHEIMHACNNVFGESEMSHLFLDSFAKQLYQVLSDNKMLK